MLSPSAKRAAFDREGYYVVLRVSAGLLLLRLPQM
jgi:hypothetical protein